MMPSMHVFFFVLDPAFSASEPILSPHLPALFSATFGLPFTSSFGTNYVRAFILSKLLSCYSAPSILCSATLSTYAKHLATCRPFQLGAHFVNYIIDTHLFIFIDAATSPTEFVTSSLVNTVFQLVPFLLLLIGYAAGY
jgi:hypothetical protein